MSDKIDAVIKRLEANNPEWKQNAEEALNTEIQYSSKWDQYSIVDDFGAE